METSESPPLSLRGQAKAAFDEWVAALKSDPLMEEPATKELGRIYQRARLKALNPGLTV